MNGLRNLVFIHNVILLSHKENEILSFASKWMELENIILSEVSQAQKAKIIYSPSYVADTALKLQKSLTILKTAKILNYP
jgi:hypothetical protein